MADAIHPVAAAGFAAAADVYERARPGYPDDAMAFLAERLTGAPVASCSTSPPARGS